MKENKRLQHGIFSMCSNEHLYSSANIGTNRAMSVGMLTGRPEEEMPGSSGDLLQELSQLHKQVRQAMESVAKALWPSASLPASMGSLYSYSRECSGVFDYGRYLPVEKVRGKLGPW